MQHVWWEKVFGFPARMAVYQWISPHLHIKFAGLGKGEKHWNPISYVRQVVMGILSACSDFFVVYSCSVLQFFLFFYLVGSMDWPSPSTKPKYPSLSYLTKLNITKMLLGKKVGLYLFYAWFSNDNNCGEIVRIKKYITKKYILITLTSFFYLVSSKHYTILT